MKYYLNKENNNKMYILQDSKIFCAEQTGEYFDIFEMDDNELRWDLMEEIDLDSAKKHYDRITGLDPEECEFFAEIQENEESDLSNMSVMIDRKVVESDNTAFIKDIASDLVNDFLEKFKKNK